jgi:phage FluMu protein gp41
LAAISEPYFSASFLVLTQIVTKEIMQQPLIVPSEPSLGRRRRKRQEAAVTQIQTEVKPKQPPLPPLSAEDYNKIRELATQVAGETAQRFVEALPDVPKS